MMTYQYRTKQGEITARDRVILGQIVEAWEAADYPMSGDVSYQEAAAVLTKLGLDGAGLLRRLGEIEADYRRKA